ncbi:hypothetical protein D9619_011946 [Psilocybe cf. subviscida]|uniref:Uncharacterized protein n=1 Tax=Psilocybe cf. subviscida TaxID=2480587 RepID=A0A8H5EW02_9AGAR|nr:hypothetical protein D9619_011946 [Psilocybe cf. subviscida]
MNHLQRQSTQAQAVAISQMISVQSSLLAQYRHDHIQGPPASASAIEQHSPALAKIKHTQSIQDVVQAPQNSLSATVHAQSPIIPDRERLVVSLHREKQRIALQSYSQYTAMQRDALQKHSQIMFSFMEQQQFLERKLREVSSVSMHFTRCTAALESQWRPMN